MRRGPTGSQRTLVAVYSLPTESFTSLIWLCVHMLEAPRYKKPPVSEALIDIRIDSLPSEKFHLLESLTSRLAAKYPNKKLRYKFEGGVQIEGTKVVASPVASGVHGLWLESEDQKGIMQLRLDGFTHNRMKPDPYEVWPGWESMREEARQVWEIYAAALNLTQITRLAVRYINQIVIPGSTIELYDYFTAPPRIPPDLPFQDILDFSNSVTIKVPKYKALAVVRHYPIQQIYPGAIAVALDIDVSRPGKVPLDSFPVWETLDQLRELKNTIFEASLLHRTKELFNK
ncbi:MAG: TIGR04255 family protein [Nitrospira sp.]|nr:MAG: TIGR04255 family protein [Nitrospira sp.]